MLTRSSREPPTYASTPNSIRRCGNAESRVSRTGSGYASQESETTRRAPSRSYTATYRLSTSRTLRAYTRWSSRSDGEEGKGKRGNSNSTTLLCSFLRSGTGILHTGAAWDSELGISSFTRQMKKCEKDSELWGFLTGFVYVCLLADDVFVAGYSSFPSSPILQLPDPPSCRHDVRLSETRNKDASRLGGFIHH